MEKHSVALTQGPPSALGTAGLEKRLLFFKVFSEEVSPEKTEIYQLEDSPRFLVAGEC